VLVVGCLALACGAAAPEPSRAPDAPAVAEPSEPAAPDGDLWERCRKTIENRCAAANPGGGAKERECRDKARARYDRIKTHEARREHLLALGCRPADVD
jgi:hypothetical protein